MITALCVPRVVVQVGRAPAVSMVLVLLLEVLGDVVDAAAVICGIW